MMYSDIVQTPSYRIGLSDGRKQGFEQGHNEGLVVGSLKEKKRIAHQLLDVLTDGMIAKKTGLALEEVLDIRKLATENIELKRVVSPEKEVLYG